MQILGYGVKKRWMEIPRYAKSHVTLPQQVMLSEKWLRVRGMFEWMRSEHS